MEWSQLRNRTESDCFFCKVSHLRQARWLGCKSTPWVLGPGPLGGKRCRGHKDQRFDYRKTCQFFFHSLSSISHSFLKLRVCVRCPILRKQTGGCLAALSLSLSHTPWSIAMVTKHCSSSHLAVSELIVSSKSKKLCYYPTLPFTGFFFNWLHP